MSYSARINKKYSYVRVYAIRKSVKGNTNSISKLVQSLINRYILKKGRGDEVK